MTDRGKAEARQNKLRTQRGRMLAVARKGNPFHDCLNVEQALRGTGSGDVHKRDEPINCKLTYELKDSVPESRPDLQIAATSNDIA